MFTSTLDAKELESFHAYYDKFIERLPAIKTQAIYAAGKALQQEVQAQVDQQGINDGFGRVKRWQQVHLGSKGGYAAVRPGKEATDSTWRGKAVDSRQITKWLERGHAVRQPSTTGGRFYGGEKTVLASSRKYGLFGVVKGKQFYSYARLTGEKKALDAAERELDRITDEWEWE